MVIGSWLRHKLHEKLPSASVTYPATDMSHNFFVAAIVVELDSTFRNDCGNAATIFSNIAQCNTLGLVRLRDKLHETLPNVTPP